MTDPIHKSYRSWSAVLMFLLAFLRGQGLDLGDDLIKSISDNLEQLIEVSMQLAVGLAMLRSKYNEWKKSRS